MKVTDPLVCSSVEQGKRVDWVDGLGVDLYAVKIYQLP